MKIIPIELLDDGGKIKKIPYDQSILGILSEFVYCDIKYLSEFLFGNIVLTKNPVTAYILSKRGYKAVSITGEIFFPNLSLMQFDYGSKISDLTKDILLSDSIESLKINLDKLKTLTKMKISELYNIDKEKITNENLLNSYDLQISECEKKIVEVQEQVNKQYQDSKKLVINNIDNSTIDR